MKVLFITWDGPQVSYLEGLFLPIFDGLRPRGIEVAVLQFGWGAAEVVVAHRRHVCAAQGIDYRFVPIWRTLWGIGPFASALMGAGHVRRAIRDWGIDVLMPRSLMPALIVQRLGRQRLLPVVFDADGLAADERVDFAGLSAVSPIYRLLRDIEAQGVIGADVTLVRTAEAAGILRDRAGPGAHRFEVVSNGRDTGQYHPQDPARRVEVRAELGIGAEAPLLVYCGSLGPQYCLPQMLALFTAVLRHRPDARLLVLTTAAAEASTAIADRDLASQAMVRTVASDAVPRYLAAADLGLAFRRPAFSVAGIRPIKLGEYLLCGVPVAGSTAGDGAEVFAMQQGGDVGDMSEAALEQVAAWFARTLPQREDYRARTRAHGIAHFSLEQSVESYAHAFEGLGRRR